VRSELTKITCLTGQDLPQWMAAAREAGLSLLRKRVLLTAQS
jgi:hypothetical protein